MRTIEQYKRLLPSDWVFADELPRKRPVPKPLDVVRITKTRILFPEAAHLILKRAVSVSAALRDRDLILFPALGWSVYPSGLNWAISMHKLREYVLMGEYRFERIPYLAEADVLLIRDALSITSHELKVVTSSRYDHLVRKPT